MKENKDLSKNIIKQIKSNKIEMKSKYIFIAEKLGLGSAITLSVVITILVLNFALYWFVNSEEFREMRLGYPMLKMMILNTPFIFVMIATMLLVIVNYIWKQFDISYKYPYQYLMPVLIVGVIILSLLLWKIGINESIRMRFHNRPNLMKVYPPELRQWNQEDDRLRRMRPQKPHSRFE